MKGITSVHFNVCAQSAGTGGRALRLLTDLLACRLRADASGGGRSVHRCDELGTGSHRWTCWT